MKIDETSSEEASYIIRETVATSRNYKQEHLKAGINKQRDQDREMEVGIEKDEDNISIV